jgi:hypothetical protein
MRRAQAVWRRLALSEAARAPERIRNWIRLNERCPRQKCQRDSSFSASVKLLFTAETVPHGVELVCEEEAFEAFCEASVVTSATDGYAEC